MTNEEAIIRLKNVQAEFNENWIDYGGINEAFEKAYQALKEEKRPQGEWVHLQAIGDYKCSICGCENLYKYANEHERWVKTNSNYCPNCGADMRGGQK